MSPISSISACFLCSSLLRSQVMAILYSSKRSCCQQPHNREFQGQDHRRGTFESILRSEDVEWDTGGENFLWDLWEVSVPLDKT